ncbi:MAG TPA: DUF2269 family protein [Gaiellaceae bacterium]|nr:DUF2269 family protein [Gaiellaceae bacterium]
MTSYELWLFLHVLAVIIWVGAVTAIDLLWFRAERTGDPAEMGRMGQLQQWLTPRLFIPSALAALVFGVLLVLDGPWSFGDVWIALGLLGFAATFLVGLLYLRPQGQRMGEIVARHGPTSPEARRHGKKLLVVARVQLLLLFLVVADMVLKPTSDDPWTLVVLAAILAVGIVAGAVVMRRPIGAEPSPAVADPR